MKNIPDDVVGGFRSNKDKRTSPKKNDGERSGKSEHNKENKQARVTSPIDILSQGSETILQKPVSLSVSSTDVHKKGNDSSVTKNQPKLQVEEKEARAIIEDIKKTLEEHGKNISDDKKAFFQAYSEDIMRDSQQFFSEAKIEELRKMSEKVQSLDPINSNNMNEKPSGDVLKTLRKRQQGKKGQKHSPAQNNAGDNSEKSKNKENKEVSQVVSVEDSTVGNTSNNVQPKPSSDEVLKSPDVIIPQAVVVEQNTGEDTDNITALKSGADEAHELPEKTIEPVTDKVRSMEEFLNEQIALLRKEIKELNNKVQQGYTIDDAEVLSREDHLRTLEKERDYVLGKGTKDIPRQEPEQEKKPEKSERDSRNYDELFIGDQWVKKGANGTEEKHLTVTSIFYQGDTLYGDIDIQDDRASTFLLEDIRNQLRNESYSLDVPGTLSEHDVPKEVPSQKSAEGEDLVFDTEKIISPDPVKKPETEKEWSNIDILKNEVELARMKWVEADVKNTTAWKKFKSLFGIEKDTKKDDTQIEYENALSNLRNAEIQALQKDITESAESLSPEERETRVAKLLRYYKLDESTNLINARTQYKAEHQNFGEKILDSLGALGRAYNRIPLKGKLLITAGFLGITAGTVLSGGSGAVFGSVAVASIVRKIASGAGVAVGTEALLESFGSRKRTAKAEESIDAQIQTLKAESANEKPEETLNKLSAFLEQDISSLNEKLQNEKRAKTWRKIGALGIGGMVGSGWLTQTVMEHTGAGEWMKTKTDALFTSHDTALPVTEKMPSPFIPKPDIDLSAEKVSDILDKDYIVQKGDSVWKIAGHTADELHLKGAEKTYFIDALKDKYGDVQLKTGDTINFSKQGIDSQFISEKLRDMKSLSSDQLASIASNDAKVAEYITEHPDTTLTNAKVDEILRGDSVTHPPDVIEDASKQPISSTGASTLSADTPDPNSVIEETRARMIQDNIAFTDPKAYLAEHPGDLSRFNNTLGRIRMNIFMMNIGDAGTPTEYDYVLNGKKLGATKIVSVLNDLSNFDRWGLDYNRELNPLHYEQMKDIAKFTEASKVAFGEEFSQVEAGEDIDSYTRRMATAALRTGKEIKGFFKP